MTSDAALALQTMLSGIWRLFDMQFPGLNMSVKSVMFGLFMIAVMLDVLRHTFGFGRGASGPADRSGKKSVSQARKNDEK